MKTPTSEKREPCRSIKLEVYHVVIENKLQGEKTRDRYIVFGSLLLDDLLRDDVSRGEKDGRSHALCRKWPLKEQVAVKELYWGLVEARGGN